MANTTEPPSLEDAMAESLDTIDRMLAQGGMPVHSRPMHAAIELVRLCIVAVDEGGERSEQPPGEFPDYAASKWFRTIYRITDDWYRSRFGSAMEAGSQGDRIAATLIRDTPYLVRVPMTTTEPGEPGEPGENFWLCYHDTVRPGEDVLSWIEHGPNFAALGPRDSRAGVATTETVASRMRSIHVALIEMEGNDGKARELRDGIMPNLERAARHLAAGAGEELRIAHWDMQMACELALKCLSQQRTGGFIETHDLFVLYDRTPDAPPPFARTELARLPNWKEMAELRYGGGPSVTVRRAFRAYQATLAIVDGAARALKRPYRIGKARFHLKRPPWMEVG